MRVVVAGATGFIGRPLVERLLAEGCQVTVVGRSAERIRAVFASRVQAVAWEDQAGLIGAMEAADGIVNLAGESIAAGRWTAARKQRLLQSRLETVRALVLAIRGAARRPGVLVNASAVGYYGPRDEPADETAAPGTDFLARICVAWEQEVRQAEALGVRVVLVRIGVVLGEDGGALAKMLLPFRLFAGGPMGSGRQWFPWVHRDDAIGLFLHGLRHPEVSGVLNAVAPDSHTNGSFSRALGAVLRRPAWLPVPAFALRLAMGEMAEALLLTGQRVEPRLTLESGYVFQYHELIPALRDVLVPATPPVE